MRLYNSYRHYDRSVASVIVNKVLTGRSDYLKTEGNKVNKYQGLMVHSHLRFITRLLLRFTMG